jgi:hypothetical protein
MRCCRYDDAVVSLKAKVLETEGEDMREAIQDKVRQLMECMTLRRRHPAARVALCKLHQQQQALLFNAVCMGLMRSQCHAVM